VTAVFLNLLVNSIFSLIAGLLVVHFFLWLFRVETGPWKLFLLSLPFAKIVYDFARGLPKDSILLSTIDTFAMPPRHHFLKAGAGLSPWGPTFSVQFSVKDLEGKMYAESVGDYLTLWLRRELGHDLLPVILSAVGLVSLALLALRLAQSIRFERERRADRRHAQTLREITLNLRRVDVYLSHHFSGTPFTGGVFRPYICIPTDAREKLSAEELEAVIAHELGHVRQLDLLATIAVQILGDLFWFVPGYRWLSRKIDRLRELVADQWAVRSGIEPVLLASALVKLKDIPSPRSFVLYSAFFRERSLLQLRVQRLLGELPERDPRFGWQNKWVRLAVSFWIFMAVMTATFGGNHRTDQIKNPKWIDQILEKWGLAVT
jgi:hypothetical protein